MHITRLSIDACLVADYKEPFHGAHVQSVSLHRVKHRREASTADSSLIPFFIGIFGVIEKSSGNNKYNRELKIVTHFFYNFFLIEVLILTKENGVIKKPTMI